MIRARTLRIVGRYVALAVALLLVLPVLPWPNASLFLPAVSPWIMAASALALRGVSMVTLLGVPVLVLVLWRRRWFCTHACPTGLVLEWLAKASPLRRRRWWKAAPEVGKWIALLTLGGAALGYPLALWLDPLAMFPALFGLARHLPGWPEALAGVALATVAIASLVAPNLWCRRLCPLGASQDMLASAVHWRLLRVTAHSSAGPTGVQALARRTMLSVGLGAVAAGLGAATGGWLTRRLAVAGEDLGPLRPPGAVDASQFGGLCVRCGNCIRECPKGILHADLGEGGIQSYLAPLLRIGGTYCSEDCNACSQVCPSGAIQRLSLPEKNRATIGIAKVDINHCLLGWDQECSVCENRCPYEAIKIQFDKVEYITLPQADPEKCTGCGACQVACPTKPKAIFVVAEPERRVLPIVEAKERRTT
ncbi:MAG: 4Fe-4S binding protein [Patescibacteria group bacterium]|nr:4Fe-4S binding protein [Patescibacteria group bacterium]